MAKDNLKEQEKLQQEKVEERVSAIETFFNENGKFIWGCLAAIVVVGAIVLAVQHFYVQPKKAEARNQMYPAEASFRNGEYELALKGDGNVLGFEQIIADYGSKAGAAAFLYAGECELELGNYEQAVSYLKKYKGKEPIMAARALSACGDALVALEKNAEALACYEKAAAKADNQFAASYLFRAGVLSEEMGESAKALAFYKKIKYQYPQSMEGYDIDKYIARIENAQ